MVGDPGLDEIAFLSLQKREHADIVSVERLLLGKAVWESVVYFMAKLRQSVMSYVRFELIDIIFLQEIASRYHAYAD